LDERLKSQWLFKHISAPFSDIDVVDAKQETNVPLKQTSFVETATALFLFIQNGHWTRVQHPSNRLEADLRQRSAKPSLGWPECQLPAPRDGWLALAAPSTSRPFNTSPRGQLKAQQVAECKFLGVVVRVANDFHRRTIGSQFVGHDDMWRTKVKKTAAGHRLL
jgi:hypothetical protein